MKSPTKLGGGRVTTRKLFSRYSKARSSIQDINKITIICLNEVEFWESGELIAY